MKFAHCRMLAVFAIFGLAALSGCGGGGTTHGATDRNKSIVVYEDPVLNMLFPDGSTGGADTLRTVAGRMKVEHQDSLGFVTDRSGVAWSVYAIPVYTRAAKVIHFKRSATRAAAPFNLLLKLDSGDEILITDSAQDPSNQLAVGYDGGTITDAFANEADLTQVIADTLPSSVGAARGYIAQTSAIVALVGWSR